MNEIIVNGIQQFDRLANAEIHGAPDMGRISAQAGSGPTDIESTVVKLGTDTRHCAIHDVHNVGWWADVNGGGTPRIHGTMYDVTVFNVGWQTTAAGDRTDEAGGHGQALYSQNFGASGRKEIDTCVFIAGFSWMKIYGTNGHIQDFNAGALSPENKLSGYRVCNSIFVGKGFLVGGVSYGVDDIVIEDCSFLDCVLLMGYNGQNGAGGVVDSLLTKGITVPCRARVGTRNVTSGRLVSWNHLDFVGNVVILPKGASVDVTYDAPTWEWDQNVYYSEEARPFVLRRENPQWNPQDPKSPKMLQEQRLTFTEWQAATGFDTNSTFIAGLPDAPMVREYEVEGLEVFASNVAVYNPTRQVDVSLPDGWIGEALIREWRRDVEPDRETVLYMTGASRALPTGWTGGLVAPLPRETLPTYGVFRLEAIVNEGDEAVIAELRAEIAALVATVAARDAELEGLTSRHADAHAQLAFSQAENRDLKAEAVKRNAECAEMFKLRVEDAKIVEAVRALWAAMSATPPPSLP